MQEAIASAVQAVSISDWPAIVTGVVTGVVGLAGIMAVYWQGKRATETASQTFRSSIDVQQDLGFLKAKLDVKPYFDLSYVKEGARRAK